MPHSGGGGHSGGGHSSSSFHSSSGSSGYTRAHHPTRGYFIHNTYYDYGTKPSLSTTFFSVIWTAFSCVPLYMGIVPLLGGEASYNEDQFEQYAFSQYEEVYDPSSPDYEEHVLTVLALDQKSENKEYHYYSMVGDEVLYNVDCLFGNEMTVLGRLFDAYIPRDYSKDLDYGLEAAVKGLEEAIISLGNASNTHVTHEASVHSSVVNKVDYLTRFDVTIVDAALAKLEASTGIVYTVVIEDFSNIFSPDWTVAILPLIVGGLFVGIGIYLFVNSIRTFVALKQANKDGTSSRYYYDESQGINVPYGNVPNPDKGSQGPKVW